MNEIELPKLQISQAKIKTDLSSFSKLKII